MEVNISFRMKQRPTDCSFEENEWKMNKDVHEMINEKVSIREQNSVQQPLSQEISE